MRIKLQQQQSWHPSGDHRLNKWLVVEAAGTTLEGSVIGPKTKRDLEANSEHKVEVLPLEDKYGE